MRGCSSSTDDDDHFPMKIKSVSSKIKLPSTIHQKERVQENYYPTDDESSDEDEDEVEPESGEVRTNVVFLAFNVLFAPHS